MKDIAKEPGVSIVAVSRALKDNPSISKEQQEKIQAYACEHNFCPNVVAKSLRNSRVEPLRVIDIIVPQLSHFYLPSTLSSTEEETSARDYCIMVTRGNKKYDREVRICQDCFENKVCGVVVSQVKDTIRYEHFQKLINHGILLMFYDRICIDMECSRVVVDDYMGIFNVVAHLMQTDCRRVVYYGTLITMGISKNRYSEYRDVITKYGLKANDRFFRIYDSRADAGLITPELLNQEKAPDAFFVVSDDTAVGILYAAKRMGYQVPEDISIRGFTNGDRAKACDPMLITVEQRGVRVGEETVSILISRAKGFISPDKIEKGTVRTRLIIRGTAR